VSRYRFRLDSVLRVRRVQEERARAQLAKARLEEVEARRATEVRRRRLRRSLDVGLPSGDPADWKVGRDRNDRLAAAVHASQAAELHALELTARRLGEWERAAADLRALERLDERYREQWRSEQLREEQRTLDEISTRRRT